MAKKQTAPPQSNQIRNRDAETGRFTRRPPAAKSPNKSLFIKGDGKPG